MDFPIISTKKQGTKDFYDLNSQSGRRDYFYDKLGTEVEELKEYLDKSTFVGFLLAKKGAGKGVYSKMMQEIFGENRIGIISIGDIVRDTNQKILDDPNFKQELINEIHSDYRGYISLEDSLDALLNRTMDKASVPTELILLLIKREIAKHPKKSFFIDGFPRTTDQVSYSLFMRDIINFRNDPDFFVLINVSEKTIDERIKYRLVCPICKTSRNYKLLTTKFVNYNEKEDKFELVCDNESCEGYSKQVMQPKEGDEKGIELIKQRLIDDENLMKMALQLHGIPKVLITNNIPIDKANLFDDYELTPEFEYELDPVSKEVITKQKPWTVTDDQGNPTYSLLAGPAVFSFIKQLHTLLVK